MHDKILLSLNFQFVFLKVLRSIAVIIFKLSAVLIPYI